MMMMTKRQSTEGHDLLTRWISKRLDPFCVPHSLLFKANSGSFPCAQQLERANGHSSSSTLEVKNE